MSKPINPDFDLSQETIEKLRDLARAWFYGRESGDHALSHLTTDSPDPDRPAEDRLAVTEEMAVAGRSAAQMFYLGDGKYGLTDECLTQIFHAMMTARRPAMSHAQ